MAGFLAMIGAAVIKGAFKILLTDLENGSRLPGWSKKNGEIGLKDADEIDEMLENRNAKKFEMCFFSTLESNKTMHNSPSESWGTRALGAFVAGFWSA